MSKPITQSFIVSITTEKEPKALINQILLNSNVKKFKVTPQLNTLHEGYYDITSVHREDIISQGYDGSKVTDEQMEEIAERMGEAYCDAGFWESLNAMLEELEIPKLKD